MAIDLGSLSLGAIFGAVATEVARAVIKRKMDSRDARNKLLRDDLDSLEKKVAPLVADAIGYYLLTPENLLDHSRKLKASIKSFGIEWNNANDRLAEFNLPRLNSNLLIKFRQALTAELDTVHPERNKIDDPVFQKMNDVSDAIRSDIRNSKYTAV